MLQTSGLATYVFNTAQHYQHSREKSMLGNDVVLGMHRGEHRKTPRTCK